MNDSIEVLPSFAVSIKHPSLKAFKDRPFSSSYTFLAVVLFFLILGVTIGLGVLAGKQVSPDSQSVIAFLFVVFLFAILYWPLKRLFKHFNRLQERSYCRRKEEVLRKTASDAIYVGLSYSRGLALLDTADWAWDRGWLYPKDGCLVFEGIVSKFTLPGDAVHSIRLVRSDFDRIGDDRQLLLEWSSQSGALEYITLAPRDGGEPRFKDVVHMVNGIIGANAGDLASGDGKLPFLSSETMKAFEVDDRAAIPSDLKTYTVVSAAAVTLAVIAGLYWLPQAKPNFCLGALFVMAMSVAGSFLRSFFVTRAVRRRYGENGLFREYMK